nr:hypothetical protein CFP56_01200 [Quercus suber]
MRGDIFQSVRAEQIPNGADHVDVAPNSDDQEIMTSGTWIGLEMAYEPIPKDQWTLPSCGNSLGSQNDHRYHFSNLYIKKDYRRISGSPGKTLVEIIESTLTAQIVSRICSSSAERLPIILRKRLIVSPENVAGSSLMNRYNKWWGYVVTGWVPKVTALLVNLTRVEQWPLPEEDPGFYSKCDWAVMETLWKINRLSIDYMTQDAVGERARV